LTVHLRRHAGNRAIVVRSEQNGKGSSVVVPLGAIAPLLRAALHRIDGAGRLTPTPDDEDADADADGGAA
jgi:DNA-binding IclR family transcriptional regulator